MHIFYNLLPCTTLQHLICLQIAVYAGMIELNIIDYGGDRYYYDDMIKTYNGNLCNINFKARSVEPNYMPGPDPLGPSSN